jgi:hypothetical protein
MNIKTIPLLMASVNPSYRPIIALRSATHCNLKNNEINRIK